MDTVKITFTEDRIVQDEHVGTEQETKFVAGKTYPLEATSADRWIKRGVAVLAVGKDKVPPPKLPDGDGEGNGDGAGQGGEPIVVDIPADWDKLHHATKRKLAREISGEDPADLAAAEAVIAAEVARRAAEI